MVNSSNFELTNNDLSLPNHCDVSILVLKPSEKLPTIFALYFRLLLYSMTLTSPSINTRSASAAQSLPQALPLKLLDLGCIG